jgi:hypothetical protein
MERRVQISTQLVDHSEMKGDQLLHSMVTCNETLILYFMPQTTQRSASTEESMASVFGLSRHLILDFLTQHTINTSYYSKLLKDRLKPAFRSKG